MRSEVTVSSNVVELLLCLWFLVPDIVFPNATFHHLISICISDFGIRLCADNSVSQQCGFSLSFEPSWVF